MLWMSFSLAASALILFAGFFAVSRFLIYISD